ncbi:hypothetical protein FQR65_LT12327 [Abscondita terminalis]|nr:hypothetical protein FQR65_LT12327 [Abscondita terminalis]
MNEELLINIVRNYPHLYLMSDKNYHNHQMKEKAWEEISGELKIPENKEKRKKSDHLTKFFESAEETTRSLPPDLQVEIKHRISTVLYKFEMKAIARSTLNADMISNTTSTSPNDVVNKNMSIFMQGNTVRSQARQMVINLLAYFEQEKDNGRVSFNSFNVCLRGNLKRKVLHFQQYIYLQRAATALGVSIASNKRVKSDHRSNPTLSSPGKKRSRKKSKSEDLPESLKMCTRNTLYTMYTKTKFQVKYILQTF